MSIDDKRNVEPIQEMLKLVQGVSRVKKWMFSESYRSIVEKRLIYDSEWCRMKMVWGGWDSAVGNSLSIYYGRLHAPNESVTMNWNGEECHAWHRLEYALHFLDGRSPAESAKLNYSTPLTSKYYDEKISHEYHHRQPEWLMNMHVEVWDHYGERFFQLFDLRRPDLWGQYRNFLKEIYDIKGRPSFITPPMDKVC